MKDRISYFDTLRGLGILMVVAIHTYNIQDGDTALFVRQIFNCAVPLFLAISGFFLAKKNVSTKENYRNFIFKQLPKVYIPMITWSLPLLIRDIYKGQSSSSSIVLLIIGGYSVYYFVSLIIQYYLMLPLLQKYFSRSFVGV